MSKNSKKNWRLEKESAYLYQILAQKEKGTPKETLFKNLSEAAESQAVQWEEKVRTQGYKIPGFRPRMRYRLLGFMVKRAGIETVRPLLSAAKIRGMALYSSESSHHSISEGGTLITHLSSGSSSAQWLRAAVFGANDGLVSNASLIIGVSGASLDAHWILVAGTAGLIAGAISMACGEFLSILSQREFYEGQLEVEREELELYPEEEAHELALIFEAKGIKKEDAKRTALALVSDPAKALDTLAREELGINPEELGSPWVAAFSSFTAFGLGALIPLIPFWLIHSHAAFYGSLCLSLIALFLMGGIISLFTGKSFFLGGLRMLGIGCLAGACTYGIGKLLGVSLS